jgi:hypothetical protein
MQDADKNLESSDQARAEAKRNFSSPVRKKTEPPCKMKACPNDKPPPDRGVTSAESPRGRSNPSEGRSRCERTSKTDTSGGHTAPFEQKHNQVQKPPRISNHECAGASLTDSG